MDLFLLALFGCILEFLVTRFGGIMLGTPTITISFLITILAVIRWNLWGLAVIPVLVLATILGGSFCDIGQYRAFYRFGGEFNCGLAVYISTMLGLSSIGLDVILYKKIGTKKAVKNPFILLGVILVNYALVNLISLISFRLISAGTFAHQATYEYLGNTGKTFNIANYGEMGLTSNLLGLAICAVAIFILRSRGVATNVVDKLIDDKKNAELDAKDRSFRIEEIEEEKEMEKEEPNDASNEAKDDLDNESSKK